MIISNGISMIVTDIVIVSDVIIYIYYFIYLIRSFVFVFECAYDRDKYEKLIIRNSSLS
jgi:hypothetical protein